MLTFLLLLLGFLFFALAAFGVGSRANLVAAGLGCWILPELISAWP